jgi:uncharacterized membrane protein YdbT with pleckstrin-like domain
MYEWLKRLVLPLLRVEDSEPHPPAGARPADMIRVERAHPGFLRLRLFQWGVYVTAWSLLAGLLSLALVIADVRFLLLVVPLVLFAIAKAATLYVTMRLDYEMRWYVITDRSLMIREGVWNVKEITLTFANAQNVRVTQGPVERLFGFSTVEIETAGGGSGGEGGARNRARLRGVGRPQEVRDLILDRVRRLRTAGLGDPDDVPTGTLAAGAERQVRGEGEHVGGLSAEVTADATAALVEVWAEARGLHEALARRVAGADGLGKHGRASP